MGWLSSIYLARSVDSSLARHTSPPRGPVTTDEVALVLGSIAGVVFLIGTGLVLEWVGVEDVSLLWTLVAVVASMLVAGLVVGYLTDAVNRTFDEDSR